MNGSLQRNWVSRNLIEWNLLSFTIPMLFFFLRSPSNPRGIWYLESKNNCEIFRRNVPWTDIFFHQFNDVWFRVNALPKWTFLQKMSIESSQMIHYNHTIYCISVCITNNILYICAVSLAYSSEILQRILNNSCRRDYTHFDIIFCVEMGVLQIISRSSIHMPLFAKTWFIPSNIFNFTANDCAQANNSFSLSLPICVKKTNAGLTMWRI